MIEQLGLLRLLIAILFGVAVGATCSDSGTLQSCAAKSEVRLLSGITIKCEVKKERP